MTYLGVDYGRVHVGLALADGPLASPLVSCDTEKAVDTIAEVVAAHKVGTVVVGLPEGPIAPFVMKFVKDLSARVSCPVVTHPETLSTHDAIQALHASRAGRKKLQNDHVYAACLILEDYLETLAL